MTMQDWFCKNLGDPMLAGDALEQIKDIFQQAYRTSEATTEMAIFIRHESEGRLQCDIILYFSPAAVDVACSVDASRCDRPSLHDLGLFAGSDAAWFLLHDKKQ